MPVDWNTLDRLKLEHETQGGVDAYNAWLTALEKAYPEIRETVLSLQGENIEVK